MLCLKSVILPQPGEMGNADAQFYLGRIYQEGEREEVGAYKGVERNLDEAVKWLSKAAAQGHERAAAALAERKKKTMNIQNFSSATPSMQWLTPRLFVG